MKINETTNNWTLIELKTERVNNAKAALFKCICGEEKIHRITDVKLRKN